MRFQLGVDFIVWSLESLSDALRNRRLFPELVAHVETLLERVRRRFDVSLLERQHGFQKKEDAVPDGMVNGAVGMWNHQLTRFVKLIVEEEVDGHLRLDQRLLEVHRDGRRR